MTDTERGRRLMDPALRHLMRVSKSVGRDPSLVQGGGGNTSVKTVDGRHMYIKASGTALKDITEQRGWCRLRVDSVLAILEDESLVELDSAERESEIVRRLAICCEGNAEAESRPSVESHLHALLGRCVVHLHPIVVGAYVCARNGQRELQRLFKHDSPPPLWVPYVDPGYKLAKRVKRLIAIYERRWGRSPSVLFLENHGLLVAAATPEKVLEHVRRTIAVCSSNLGHARVRRRKAPPRNEVVRLKLAIRRGIFQATGRYVAVAHFSDDCLAAFLARRDAQALISLPALLPDELVYANGPPLWLEPGDAESVNGKLKRQMERGKMPAVSFLVPGVGLFAAGSEKSIPTITEVAAAALLVRAATVDLGGPEPLTRRQRDFIIHWEAENFRREIARGPEAGELMGRIAVVTGAGSGLGRSIAIGLARAGACVALADLDLPSAEETASLISKEAPVPSSAAVRCDVTAEKEVDQAFAWVLDRWGGLDILVNAAGIAPPYALSDLPVEQWRAALEVNLTGYFLMARAAARIMIQQGMGGSIINLSSKSGLDASRSNTAYNATKAGEIHMARGWALELGEYGIRVNSVAPGNVFEGSKIWNPEYIRACAKKYGIKPEEVIPYYVNMTALRRRITGLDVANAVVFLCSDRARTITGQTLVPDSGQVMVR